MDIATIFGLFMVADIVVLILCLRYFDRHYKVYEGGEWERVP